MTRDRLYSRMLNVYPRPFRREYGEDMMEAFRALSCDIRSPLQFWGLVLRDLFRRADDRIAFEQSAILCGPACNSARRRGPPNASVFVGERRANLGSHF